MPITRFDGIGVRGPSAKTATFTADDKTNWYTVDATGGNITINLPTAARYYKNGRGGIVFITRLDGGANVVTVDPAGSETVDGGATTTIAASARTAFAAVSTSAWRRIL